MGLFDFLKPLSQGMSQGAHSAGEGLSSFLHGSVSQTPGAPVPGAPMGAQQPPLTGDFGPPDGLQRSGVQRAAMPDTTGLTAAPTMTKTPGFLDKLRDPSADGLTLQDKIMAMGSILQGDSQGAQAGLHSARQGYRQQKLDDQNKAGLAAKSAAFKNAFDPVTGKFDMAKYAGALGDAPGAFDPDEAARLQNAFRHQVTPMNANGGIYAVDTSGEKPSATELVHGHQKPGMFNDDGSVNPDYIRAMSQIAEGRAAATARHRAPPRPAGAGRRPGSYTSSDVSY